MHGEIPGRTVSGEVHPVGASNKTLISDTATHPAVLSYVHFYIKVLIVLNIHVVCTHGVHRV